MLRENDWYAHTNSFHSLQSIRKRLRRLMEGNRSTRDYETLLEEIFLDKIKNELISNIIEINSLKELQNYLLDLTKNFPEEHPPDASLLAQQGSRPSVKPPVETKDDFFQRIMVAPARKEFIPPPDHTRDPFELARSVGLNLESDYDYNSAVNYVLESSLKKEHKYLLLRYLLEDKFPNMDEDKLEIAARALWKRIEQHDL